MERNQLVRAKVRDTLIRASSSFDGDLVEAYRNAIARETTPTAKWVMQQILENAVVAERCNGPLCDDTGLPQLLLEIGPNQSISGNFLSAVYEGVAEGLRALPGRPMAVNGDAKQRLEQSGGLNEDPGALVPPPLVIKQTQEDVIRLHVIMQGGGPEIRGKTYRVFHKHDISVVLDELVNWAIEAVSQLGCTPCTLAIGVGRSHFEAAAMMLEAQVYGRHNIQDELEQEITERVNKSQIGALGLRGDTTVLATFLKIGAQRASGVRIVSMRPCCCVEPRLATIELA